jgi:hypothetical protein
MVLACNMDINACFSAHYAEARDRFRAAVPAKRGGLGSIPNPNHGPRGEELAIDLGWFGAERASKVLVLVSATHGVEGFCGSGAQLDWMLSGGSASLPADTAVLLVHAINPHGFAWLRRVTEEGIDLNRNFFPKVGELPPNPGYEVLAEAFVPRDFRPETLAAADAKIAMFRASNGSAAVDHALSFGQHTNPEGVYYGGREAAWSMRKLAKICADFRLGERASVAIIDYHTGLGPHGHGEPIVGHRPGESGQLRCRAWYGDSLGEPLLGSSSSIPIAGLTQYAWAREIGEDRLTFIALEYGTYPLDQGQRALRDDHILHRSGLPDWNDPHCQRIKCALRKFNYPDVRPWKEMVLFRSRQVIEQALAGLSGALAGEYSNLFAMARPVDS